MDTLVAFFSGTAFAAFLLVSFAILMAPAWLAQTLNKATGRLRRTLREAR